MKQSKILLTLSENDYTNAIEESDAYRAPLPAEQRLFELVNLVPCAHFPGITHLFRFRELIDKVAQASDGYHDLPFEDWRATGATENKLYRRLLKKSRLLYQSNHLHHILPFGRLESLALPGQRYQLTLTPGLLTETYRRGEPPQNLLSDREIVLQNATLVAYDVHDLAPIVTTDAVGNTMGAELDYRVLAPRLLTDPNGNRSEVAFDALGLVAGTAVMGKSGENLGDSLQGFEADLSPTQLEAFLNNPHGAALDLLGHVSTRIIYDVRRYHTSQKPVFAGTIARETHVSDLRVGEQTKTQISLSYSDGFGREIQKKLQAKPGCVNEGGPLIHPRWIGSGWTIFNNKGKPVRQYEPFFSALHDFEFASIKGVSPILFYDPIERVVATLHSNHTFEKVVFDP